MYWIRFNFRGCLVEFLNNDVEASSRCVCEWPCFMLQSVMVGSGNSHGVRVSLFTIVLSLSTAQMALLSDNPLGYK